MAKKLKNLQVLSKNAKIRDVKILKKHSISLKKKQTVNYHQTLEEPHWLLRLEKPKKTDNNFQKHLKIIQVLYKKIFFWLLGQ